jgi:uncharacterized protein (DUF433 family)
MAVVSIAIYSDPAIRGGEVLMREGVGIPIKDLLSRLDAGDQLEFVAEDFNVEPDALSLLLDLRKQLQGDN